MAQLPAQLAGGATLPDLHDEYQLSDDEMRAVLLIAAQTVSEKQRELAHADIDLPMMLAAPLAELWATYTRE